MIPYGECARNFHDLIIYKKCFNKKIINWYPSRMQLKKVLQVAYGGSDFRLGENNIFFEQNSQSEI